MWIVFREVTRSTSRKYFLSLGVFRYKIITKTTDFWLKCQWLESYVLFFRYLRISFSNPFFLKFLVIICYTLDRSNKAKKSLWHALSVCLSFRLMSRILYRSSYLLICCQRGGKLWINLWLCCFKYHKNWVWYLEDSFGVVPQTFLYSYGRE